MASGHTKHGEYRGVKPPPGRPAARRKPLRERLHRAGITYGEVAAAAQRAHSSVRAHIDGRIYSPAIQAAIDRLAPATKGSAA